MPNFYIAIGATASWSPQAETLSGNIPLAAVNGAGQTLNAGATPTPAILMVTDAVAIQWLAAQ
jgi:hypothetical protein